MKSSHTLLPVPRRSLARMSFTVTSCIAAAAIALTSPLFAAQPIAPGGQVAETGVSPDNFPGSMRDSVQVMVELSAPPATAIYAAALKQAEADAAKLYASGVRPPLSAAGKPVRVDIDAAAASQVKNQVVTNDAAQQSLLPSLGNVGAKVIFRTQRVYNGIAIKVDPRKISEIAAMPGVKAVHPMNPKYRSAFSDLDFLGVRAGYWTKSFPTGNLGIHGENIKIGVIDSGLDYIHTNFGGPGTAAAYAGTSDTGPFPNAFVDTAKVAGGYDFAGDAYDANTNDTPHPDPNPWDGSPTGSSAGHGTACASLIAGYGVNFGNTTYLSNYDNSTPIASMKIAPGMAPRAKLVPLRVFGNNGSTNLVTEAIEYAVDPNKDGNFSDKVDIISMSLGSSEGYSDDDSAVASTNASDAGVIVVASAGNSGDSYYITGSPSVAGRVLSVAASFNDQAGFISNAQVCNGTAGCNAQPPSGSLAGQKGLAIYSNTSPRPTATPATTFNVVRAVPPLADSALTNAAQVNGNIVLIDRGVNTFSDKADKAMAAGAKGIIIANNNRAGIDPTNDPITQDTSTTVTPLNIPDVMISFEDGNYIKAAANFNATTGVPANPTRVSIQPDNTTAARTNAPADTMPAYSSRGPRYPDSFLKPDITAPAEVVGVAASRTQPNEVALFNGTSSSAPHVSGIMALIKQQHPSWSIEEMMALAMNTSLHNLETTTARTTKYADGRVGAGRIDANFASQSDVVAFNSTDPGLVSVSFGIVEVPTDGVVHLVKNVTVRNKGTAGATYRMFYEEMGPAVGDSYYGTTSPLTFTVNAGSQVVIPLQFNATGNTLEHNKESSVGSASPGNGLARQYLTEKTGYLVLAPQGGSQPTLRVPLHAAPKPVSSLHATVNGFVPTTDNGQIILKTSGAPVNTPSAFPVGIISLFKPLELQYASPLAGTPNSPTDPNRIKYVGVTSDWSSRTPAGKAATRIIFGIDGFGNSVTPEYHGSDREIFFDTDRNGTEDFAMYLEARANGTSHSNVYTPAFVNLYTGAGVFLGFFTNIYGGNQLDTNSFNNSVSVFTVEASRLGYTGGQSKFNYEVVTFSRNNDLVDFTGPLTYDIARPGFDCENGIGEPFMYQDFPGDGGAVPCAFNGANIAANNSKGVLLLHMHNATGQRSDVVVLYKPTITSFTPIHGKVGTQVSITGTNFGNGTKVSFNGVQATQVTPISPNTIEARVPAGATTGPITVSNAGGSSTSSQVFTVDAAATTPSPSPSTTPSPTKRVTTN